MTENLKMPVRKLPALEPESAFFWTSGQTGVLHIQHCASCNTWQHPPSSRCRHCHSGDLSPRPVSGRGKVRTFTVNRQPWLPGCDPVFVFAAVELAEQDELYVFSNVLAEPDSVHSGMEVEVTFEQQEDVWIPLFQPLEPKL